MAILGKAQKSIRKKFLPEDILAIPKTIAFIHEFTSDTDTLDLSNLNHPTGYEGIINPSLTEIINARVSIKTSHIYIQKINSPRILPFIEFYAQNDLTLKFNIGFITGDIVVGYIHTYANHAKAIDAYTINKTGILNLGESEIITDLPFIYNKNSSSQVGDVLVFVNGSLLRRCLGNNLTLNGDYIEVAPNLGGLTNTIKLKEPVAETSKYTIISNGSTVLEPTESWLKYTQGLAVQVDKLVEVVSDLSLLPTSHFQPSPNEVDLGIFGSKVNSIFSETLSNCIVGTQAQYNAGKVTHTTIQSAIDSCAIVGKVIVLSGDYPESIILNRSIILEGRGYNTRVNSLQITSNFCSVKDLSFINSLLITSDSNFISNCYILNGATFTNSGLNNNLTLINL